MAENLNYATDSSMCYQNKPEYCDEYGRLYKWIDAQNACPAGCHLPDTTEWNELFYAVAGKNIAGEVLKSIPYWQRSTWTFRELKGIYGFSALPAGIYNGYFDGEGDFTLFWTATESLDNKAYQVQIDRREYSDYLGARMGDHYVKGSGLSIRCVKD
jgi:uncharacterized protein (TIGR02145 family)